MEFKPLATAPAVQAPFAQVVLAAQAVTTAIAKWQAGKGEAAEACPQ